MNDIERDLMSNIESVLANFTFTSTEDESFNYAVTQIESCISAINLVSETFEVYPWTLPVLQLLEESANLLIQVDEDDLTTRSRIGRPSIFIPKQKLEYLLSMNFKVPDIAKMLGVTSRTIFNRFRQYELSVSQTYSLITDEDLQNIVTEQLLTHPNTGYKRMKGFLVVRGIRVTDQRVREVMRVVDPNGVYQRTRANRAIVRREYFVPYFNSIWHMDGNHKLNRWGFVVRCGIDGKTRLATYISATGNNRADTHFEAFLKGVEKYGIPLRTRSDKGGENVIIAEYMIQNRGLGRASHICGKSVHNQRIERFWKDVFYGSLAFFYNVFRTMEENFHLNIDDKKHICILHHVFLPRLNQNLNAFIDGWNNHPLSSEHNHTPRQLMLMHLPPLEYDLHPEPMLNDDVFLNNIDDLRNVAEIDEETIINPIIDYSCLNLNQIEYLNRIDPLRPSNTFGYDIYLEAMQCLVE